MLAKWNGMRKDKWDREKKNSTLDMREKIREVTGESNRWILSGKCMEEKRKENLIYPINVRVWMRKSNNVCWKSLRDWRGKTVTEFTYEEKVKKLCIFKERRRQRKREVLMRLWRRWD